MVNIKDVAKLSGVSVATVSNYINKTKNVSETTAERIDKAINQLGYIPNRIAGNLKKGTAKSVGVILPNISDSYYVQMFEGIEGFFSKLEIPVSLKITKDIKELEQKFIYDLMQYRTSGIICVSSMPENGDFYKKHCSGIPFIQIDRKIDGFSSDFLGYNNKSAIYHLVEKYSFKGLENIVLISGPREFSCEQSAVEGFLKAVNTLSLKDCRFYRTVLSKESAFRTTLQYMNTNTPSVIITTSKLVSEGVSEAIALSGNDCIIETLSEDNWNTFSRNKNGFSTSRRAIQLGEKSASLIYNRIMGEAPESFCNLSFENRLETINNGFIKRTGELNVIMLDTLQVTMYSALISRFTNRTNIKINIKKVKHKDLLSEIYRDKNSDVFMFDMPWLYSLAQNNILCDITDYIKTPNFKDVFLDGFLDKCGKFSDKYFGLPFMYAPQILFYRKDLFNDEGVKNEYKKLFDKKLKCPITWKEFNNITEFFSEEYNSKSQTKYGTAIPCAYSECITPELYMRMRAFGGEIYDSNLKITMYSDGNIKAYKSFYELYNMCSPNCIKYDDSNVVEEFLDGNIAMLITYPSFMSNINDLQKSYLTGKVGFAPIPLKCPVLGGWSLGISSSSNKKDEAFEFIDWACGEDMANHKTLMSGQSAVDEVFSKDELISLYPWLPLYKSVYPTATPIYPPYQEGHGVIPIEKIDDILASEAYLMISNQKTPEASVYSCHRRLEGLFKEYYVEK